MKKMNELSNTAKKPVILVTLIEAGMGHIVSATAIADALKVKYGDKVEVCDRHILRDSDSEVLHKYEQFLVDNVKGYSKYPSFGYFQLFSMYILGPQNSLRFVHRTVMRKQVDALVAEYAKIKPDVIVATHYYPLFCAVKYRNTYDKNVKVISYCPDNTVHGWWDARCDMMYTNNSIATEQAYNLTFRSGRVCEAFYPTRKAVIDANESKEFYREKFGIPQDKFAVVVADGVYAEAKAKDICLELIESDLPLTVCLLAGKNEEIRQEFEQLKSTVKPNITLLTFGFMSNAPELYKACDLFITKAGPNAILDSVMMDTPVIVDFCATPIEYATKNLFTKNHLCGQFISNPHKIKQQVEEYVLHPELLNEFSDSLQYFDKSKNGSEEIADDIIEMLFDPQRHLDKHYEQEDAVIDRYFNEQAAKSNERYNEILNDAVKISKKRERKLYRSISATNFKYAKKASTLKRKFHSGKASKQYASILIKINENNQGK